MKLGISVYTCTPNKIQVTAYSFIQQELNCCWDGWLGWKVGEACCASFRGAAGSASNTMSPGPRPNSVPSGILIHPTVWTQYTNITDRQDKGDVSYRRTAGILVTVVQKLQGKAAIYAKVSRELFCVQHTCSAVRCYNVVTCMPAVVFFQGDNSIQRKQSNSQSTSVIALRCLGVEHIRVLSVGPDDSIRHDGQRHRLWTVSTLDRHIQSRETCQQNDVLFNLCAACNTCFLTQAALYSKLHGTRQSADLHYTTLKLTQRRYRRGMSA